MSVLKDVQDELKQFLSGKTIDAIIPPIIYVIMNNIFTLKIAVFISLTVAVLFSILRLFKKESALYALFGISGVVLASSFALYSDNASNYFLPKILGSGALFLAIVVSLFIGKPAAAVLSHLSRGWTFSWFMREDVKPAYREDSVNLLLVLSQPKITSLYLLFILT